MNAEEWPGEKWIADTWQAVDHLKGLRAGTEKPEEIRIIEENARYVIAEIRRLTKMALEIPLDQERWIEEADKILDAALELIRG